MTSTIINKGISKLSFNSSGGPTDEDFIRSIDYDELEKNFQVHKYYPQFIHNDLPTPSLKEMIANKPIYAKANGHLTKEQKREQMKEFRREHMREQKQMKEQRKQQEQIMLQEQIKQNERQQQRRAQQPEEEEQNRWCSKADTSCRRASRPDHGVEEATRRLRQMGRDDEGGHSSCHAKHEMVFRNPFDSNLSTLIENDPTTTANKTQRQNSIGGKFMSFLKGRLDDESADDNKLVPSKSYDQTKSSMTTTRKVPKPHGLKTKINELTGRRYTDHLSMYFFE